MLSSYYVGKPVDRTAVNVDQFDDTVRFHLTLATLHADGSPAWKRSIAAVALYPGDFGLAGLGSVLCKPGCNGQIFVLVNVLLGQGPAPIVTPFLFVFSSGGDLLWSRTYGRYELNYSTWDYGVTDIEPADDCGGYLFSSGSGIDAANGVRLLHFTPNGDIEWLEHPAYTNNNSWSFNDVMLDANNEPVLAGGLMLGDPNYGFALRIHPSGQFDAAHLYPGVPTYFGYSGAARIGGDDLFMAGPHAFVRTAMDGGVQAAVALSDASVTPNDLSFQPVNVQVVNDRVVLPGNVTSTHQIFGYHQYFPQVWSFSMEQPDGCLMQSLSVSAIDVPDTLIQIIVDTTYHSAVVLAQISPATFLGAYHTPIPTQPACDLFVGLNAPSDHDLFEVLNNVVVAGGTISVRSSEPATVVIYAPDGSRVSARLIIPVGSTTNITTSGMSPGTYFLHALAEDGSWANTQKVTLIR